MYVNNFINFQIGPYFLSLRLNGDIYGFNIKSVILIMHSHVVCNNSLQLSLSDHLAACLQSAIGYSSVIFNSQYLVNYFKNCKMMIFLFN